MAFKFGQTVVYNGDRGPRPALVFRVHPGRVYDVLEVNEDGVTERKSVPVRDKGEKLGHNIEAVD